VIKLRTHRFELGNLGNSGPGVGKSRLNHEMDTILYHTETCYFLTRAALYSVEDKVRCHRKPRKWQFDRAGFNCFFSTTLNSMCGRCAHLCCDGSSSINRALESFQFLIPQEHLNASRCHLHLFQRSMIIPHSRHIEL